MMGEKREQCRDENTALRFGLDLGVTVIDTAQMYGDGTAETLIRWALAGARDTDFVFSKVYPQYASLGRLPLFAVPRRKGREMAAAFARDASARSGSAGRPTV